MIKNENTNALPDNHSGNNIFIVFLAIASPSVLPTAATSKHLSTVENFPASEVLNRNKDDIEKGKKASNKIL